MTNRSAFFQTAAIDNFVTFDRESHLLHSRRPFWNLKPMPKTRGLTAPGAGVLLAFCACAQAAPPTRADDITQLDRNIQALKEELLDFNREAAAVEVDTVLPAYDRINVYLAVKVAGLLVQDVTVSIDGGKPEIYHYDETDARALLAAGSVQRILRATAEPGPHRVRISFTGRMLGADPKEALITDRYEVAIDKPSQVADLEFIIAPHTRLRGQPKLTMKQWRMVP